MTFCAFTFDFFILVSFLFSSSLLSAFFCVIFLFDFFLPFHLFTFLLFFFWFNQISFYSWSPALGAGSQMAELREICFMAECPRVSLLSSLSATAA